MDLGVNVTMDCNLSCHYCYLYVDGKLDQRNLSIEDFKTIMDASPDVETVTLSGGEPFQRHDITVFFDHLAARGLRTHVYTNVTILDQSILQRLRRYDLRLVVTYRPPWDRIRRKMLEAKEAGLAVSAHLVIDRSILTNLEPIFASVSFVDELRALYPTNTGGASPIRMFTADEWLGLVERMVGIASRLGLSFFYEPAFIDRSTPGVEDLICPAGTDAFVHVDAKAYPCCLLVDSPHGREVLGGPVAPIPFDYRECPILNVPQKVENARYRRLCPLVFRGTNLQQPTFPSRLERSKS